MIWVHCGDASQVASTQSLALRLAEQSDGAGVLVTAQASLLDEFAPWPSGIEVDIVPPDSPTKARAFLTDWAPDYLIWNGGALRPALLKAVYASRIGASLINAQVAGIIHGSSRWIPGAARTAVQAFEQIMTADGATATRLRRGSVPADIVQATGPILEEPIPLPHDPNELSVMAEALEARPVWYAANVASGEVTHMAAAQLAASRKSHRMMLLLTPNDPDAGPAAASILRDAGLKTGVRSQGDDPKSELQAYVADIPGEMGLWYRIAPLTFIGGTMATGTVASPFDPIVVGSAVIHGTRKAAHAVRFERLAQVQASREIRSAGELGIAVATLLAPEHTARMALAGWEEMTRNADIINDLITTALTHADTREDAT